MYICKSKNRFGSKVPMPKLFGISMFGTFGWNRRGEGISLGDLRKPSEPPGPEADRE